MATLYYWVLLVLTANGKGTDTGCLFRMSFNLQECSSRSWEVANDHLLPRKSQTFFSISSPLGRIKKDWACCFVFLSSMSVAGKGKRIKSLTFLIKLTEIATRPLTITRISTSPHLWLVAQSNAKSQHSMGTFQGLPPKASWI